jgi:hypothetical protein
MYYRHEDKIRLGDFLKVVALLLTPLPFLIIWLILSNIPPGPDTKLAQQVTEAEQRWNALGITDYRFSVLTFYSGNWEFTYNMTVKGGIVTEYTATCKPGALNPVCPPPPYNLEEFTIPVIFGLAKEYAPQNGTWHGKNNEKTKVEIEFDPVYSYPSRIYYDPTLIFSTDDERNIIVKSFEKL